MQKAISALKQQINKQVVATRTFTLHWETVMSYEGDYVCIYTSDLTFYLVISLAMTKIAIGQIATLWKYVFFANLLSSILKLKVVAMQVISYSHNAVISMARSLL